MDKNAKGLGYPLSRSEFRQTTQPLSKPNVTRPLTSPIRPASLQVQARKLIHIVGIDAKLT